MIGSYSNWRMLFRRLESLTNRLKAWFGVPLLIGRAISEMHNTAMSGTLSPQYPMVMPRPVL